MLSSTPSVRLSLFLGLLSVALVFAGCGTGEDDAAEEETGTVVITPVGNEMYYEVEEFTVQAGEQVHLVFDNTETTDPAMNHNVVILNTDDSEVADEVGQAAVEAGMEADWIPDHEAIYANTAIAAPGEQVEVTFTAPEEPGTYIYLCTYPGHYITMRGTMIVE